MEKQLTTIRRWLGWLINRPWLLNSLLGAVAGLYAWQFLATNQDFTGPLPVSLPAGLALTFLAGPLVVVGLQVLSALLLARWSGRPFRECLQRDALSPLPLGLLGLSPLLGLLTGIHTPACHAGVVVLVSLVLSGCLAGKAATAWAIFQGSPRRPALSERPARHILVGVIILYVALFSLLQVLRYDAYQLWGVDHTRVTQALWNSLHGRFLRFTFVGGTDMNLLADHFEPIFLLLLPLYALWPDPRLPLIVQVVLLSLAAWPVYRLALRRIGRPYTALGWALTYLLLPMIIWAAQDCAGAVRSDALAIPVFLFMLDALDRQDWSVFALTVALALATKQYMSLLVAMLGLYLALRQRRRVLGLGLFAMGVLWFVAVVQWVMPALQGGPNLTLTVQYGEAVGEAGLAGLAQLLVQEPIVFVARAFSTNHILFLFFLLFSFGGLALLDSLLALIGLPIFAIFALALPHQAVNLGNHHYFSTVPFLLIAAINGSLVTARQIARRKGWNLRQATVGLTAFALGMSLASSFFWTASPLGWRFWDYRSQVGYWANSFRVEAHARLADQFVASIPPNVPVLSSDYLLAHLGNRPEVYHFFWPPEDVLERVDYVVVDLLENQAGRQDARLRNIQLLGQVFERSDLTLTAFADGLLLFERDGVNGYLSSAQVLDVPPAPQTRVERELGNRLRLLGYDPPASPLRPGERYRVSYYWQVLEGFDAPFTVQLGINPESIETLTTNYVLADRLVGAAGEFSVLHLPTYVQLPPTRWQPGQVIRETYEFCLPADAQGDYRWSVGLYAVPRFLGIRFRSDRLVPGSAPVELGTLTVQP